MQVRLASFKVMRSEWHYCSPQKDGKTKNTERQKDRLTVSGITQVLSKTERQKDKKHRKTESRIDIKWHYLSPHYSNCIYYRCHVIQLRQ